MLPAVLAWNSAQPNPRVEQIAAASGKPQATASAAVRDLVRSLGLPGSLPAVGVVETQLEQIADQVARHPVVQRNSRPIARAEQVTEILALAWDP